MLPLLLIAALCGHSEAITAFDCDNPTPTHHLRLDKVADCEPLDSGLQSQTEVTVQVIHTISETDTSVTECVLEQTLETGFCGRLDSISYGIVKEIETQALFYLSVDECNKLVNNKEIVFHGNTYKIATTTRFSIEHFLQGNRTENDDFSLVIREKNATEAAVNISREKNYASVDRVDNVNFLASYNLIVNSNNIHEAFKQVGDKICNNERKSLEQLLEIIRQDPEKGIVRALGFGYTAVIKGDAAHVFGCREVNVTYRHIPEDTQFMPVSFEGKKMFLDGATKILRENSTFLPVNEKMPVMWNVDGFWSCKSGDRPRYDCKDDPTELAADMTKVKEAIRFNPNETALGGGIYSREDIQLARLENQRKSNSEFAVQSFGDTLSYSNLPQGNPVGPSGGLLPVLGTPEQFLAYLGIEFGLNWRTFFGGVGVVTFACSLLNYFIQIVKNYIKVRNLARKRPLAVPCWLYFPGPLINTLFTGCVKKIERGDGIDVELGKIAPEPEEAAAQLTEEERVRRRRHLVQATKCVMESEISGSKVPPPRPSV